MVSLRSWVLSVLFPATRFMDAEKRKKGMRENGAVFWIIGAICLAAWLADAYLVTQIYQEYGLLLWYCSFIFMMLGFGAILRSPSLLMACAATGVVIQSIWIADFSWMAFLGRPLSGVAQYSFAPGYSGMEFLINVRHFLIIPFSLYLLFRVGKKGKWSAEIITGTSLLVFVLSYVFGREKNVNCVLKPCIAALDSGMRGQEYVLILAGVCIAFFLCMKFILEYMIDRMRALPASQSKVVLDWCFIVVIIISFLILTAGYMRYTQVPKYSCASVECSGCLVKAECRYVRFSDDKRLWVEWTLQNTGPVESVCDLTLKQQAKASDKVGASALGTFYIRPGEKRKMSRELEVPAKDTLVSFNASCHPIGE